MRRYLVKHLSIYIIKRIIFSFLLFFITSSILLIFVSFIQYADIFITTNVNFIGILKVLFWIYPIAVELAIPISLVASLVYIIYVMKVKNELLSIELIGDSRYIIGIPILTFSFIILLTNFLFSTFLFPFAIHQLKKIAVDFVCENLKNSIIENQLNDDIPDTVIFFKKKVDDKFRNLFVFQKKDEENLLIYAKEGYFYFGEDSFSVGVGMNDGHIIGRGDGEFRVMQFFEGVININISEIIEKRIKNIRGFYQPGEFKDKDIHIHDGLYLSFVNVYIAILSILIFLQRPRVNLFVKYLRFFIFIAVYYIGFRMYHSLYECGFMSITQSLISVLLIIFLLIFITERPLLSR